MGDGSMTDLLRSNGSPRLVAQRSAPRARRAPAANCVAPLSRLAGLGRHRGSDRAGSLSSPLIFALDAGTDRPGSQVRVEVTKRSTFSAPVKNRVVWPRQSDVLPMTLAGADLRPARGDDDGSGAVEGLIPSDRHAMSVPTLRKVVPHGVMLDAAVVPEGDGALLPAEAALELRRLD